jgi:hypothetical protein
MNAVYSYHVFVIGDIIKIIRLYNNLKRIGLYFLAQQSNHFPLTLLFGTLFNAITLKQQRVNFFLGDIAHIIVLVNQLGRQNLELLTGR